MFSQTANSKKGSNNNKKSTKSSEQGSFQKSLHEGIHFRQCPKSQEFGTIERSEYFLRKAIGETWEECEADPLISPLNSSMAPRHLSGGYKVLTIQNHLFQESFLDIPTPIKLASASLCS